MKFLSDIRDNYALLNIFTNNLFITFNLLLNLMQEQAIGVPTPYNSLIVDLIHAVEGTYEEEAND